MKKKALFILSLLCATACFAVDFTCLVSINSSTAAPSLEFGCGADKQTPFPPVSDIFNVKDFFIVNEAATGDLMRLGTDIRSGANTWKINCFNSDGTLYFKAANGSLPTLNYAYYKDNELVSGTVENAQLKVLAGTIVTLSTKSVETQDVSKADASQYAVKQVSEEYGKEVYQTKEASFELNGACKKVFVNVAVPMSEVIIQLKGAVSGYYKEGVKIAAIPADFKGYILSITLGSNTTFEKMEGGKVSAKVTLLVNAVTRGADTLSYQVTATDNNQGNIQATITEVGDGDNSLAQTLVRAVVPVEIDSTLDFDGNGEVNMNDAVFFYNYVCLGGLAMDYSQIIPYAIEEYSDDLEADAEAAFDYFESKLDDLEKLSLVPGEEITCVSDLINSATLFYNYASFNGMAMDATQIMPYTSLNPNDEDDVEAAQEVFDKIEEVFVAK